MPRRSTTRRIKRTAKRAKKTVRRGSAKAKTKVGSATKAVKRGARKAKKTATRAKKAVRSATKKVKKTARRAKKAVKRATKKVKRKARKSRIAQAAAARVATRQAVAEANASFMRAFNTGDIHAAAQAYTEDALVLPPGGPEVRGREAIEAFWVGAVERMGVTTIELETIRLDSQDRSAHEVGRYRVSGRSGLLDEGKYVVVWKREVGGAWKLHVDIWNSSASAPAG